MIDEKALSLARFAIDLDGDAAPYEGLVVTDIARALLLAHRELRAVVEAAVEWTSAEQSEEQFRLDDNTPPAIAARQRTDAGVNSLRDTTNTYRAARESK